MGKIRIFFKNIKTIFVPTPEDDNSNQKETKAIINGIQGSIDDIRSQQRSLLTILIGAFFALAAIIIPGFFLLDSSLSNNIETKFSTQETRFSSIDNSIHTLGNRIIDLSDDTNTKFTGLYNLLLGNNNEAFLKMATNSVDRRTLESNPGLHSRIILFLEDYSKELDLFEMTNLKEFENAGCATWSPVSPEMTFISLNNHDKLEGKICIYNYLDNSIETLVEAGIHNLHPKISPNGNKIVYSHRIKIKVDEKEVTRSDIFIFDRITKKSERLTFESDRRNNNIGNLNFFPAWSPDGNWIIFCGDDSETDYEGFSLFIMDKNGKHKENICKLGDTCKASFSPDGNWIVLETEDGRSLHDIWLAPIIGGRLVMAKSELEAFEFDTERFEKIGKYYFVRLSDHDLDNNTNACIDPVWINEYEVMYLFSDETKETPLLPTNVNWTIKKININTRIIVEEPLHESTYRCPQPRIVY